MHAAAGRLNPTPSSGEAQHTSDSRSKRVKDAPSVLYRNRYYVKLETRHRGRTPANLLTYAYKYCAFLIVNNLFILSVNSLVLLFKSIESLHWYLKDAGAPVRPECSSIRTKEPQVA